ncbi:DUF937 domain-containing protein [Calidifontibacter sp. DB0510]|uniref:DUF937 domain-containing protein n=1 Tax=Metallococcus carri TaxID=1656884 RepID=A0A967AZH7_9MICO|nr:DUF937 domain-containing protein [Metallococcus carri]NHN55971.1 DUF937 domain-containing protein [Metallococcus carri]NOP37572.1 DUF937 domain-containing protein [Calidifontibacter sp. DB2511S]
MSAVDDALSQVPMDQLAAQVGAPEDQTRQAAQQAAQALLGGLQANAQDPAGAQSLMGALNDHQGRTPDVSSVDTGDGAAIVNNIFGGQQDEVANRLGGLPGGNNDLVKKLLPILAPIILSYIANQVQGKVGGGAAPQPTPQQPGQPAPAPVPTDPSQPAPAPGQNPGDQGGAAGGGLGDILGQILGGAAGGGTTGGAGGATGGLGGGLGGILGDILGGGRKA